jgi:2-(1,2-epoxy-1,2-dihydrophenyl)acetyl-CoA isomerase
VTYATVPGLDVALAGGVLTLRLAKPEKRNALDDTMMYALIDAIDAAGRDEEVRAVVLTSAGDHFCSGFDILGRNQPGAVRPRVGSLQRRLPAHAHRLIPVILEVQVPVVCVVRGWAAGIGLNLALAADFTIAATDARFWAPFVERGFTADSGAAWMLPRRVGEARAREMLELNRVVSGAEAAEWEMVHGSVPLEELDATADALVSSLASTATVALGLTKWLMHVGRMTSLIDHHRDEAFALEISSRSDDAREGTSAFAEGHDPKFEGR